MLCDQMVQETRLFFKFITRLWSVHVVRSPSGISSSPMKVRFFYRQHYIWVISSQASSLYIIPAIIPIIVPPAQS